MKAPTKALFLSHLVVLSILTSCTKKAPSKDLDVLNKPDQTAADTATHRPEALSAPRSVSVPTLVRVDEDTIQIRAETDKDKVGLVSGSEVVHVSTLATKAPVVISKDETLYLVKASPSVETAQLAVDSFPDRIEVKVDVKAKSDIMIVASGSSEESETLCLDLKGPSAGNLISTESADCWSSPDAIASALKPNVSSASVELVVQNPDTLITLKDHPFLSTKTRAHTAPETTTESGIPVLVVPETSETPEIMESLPVIAEETMMKDFEEILVSPTLAVEEKERIESLKDRMKRGLSRYKDKTEKSKDVREKRNKLRAERIAAREKLVSEKSKEQKTCKKKLKACDENKDKVSELESSEKIMTQEIAELKDNLENSRTEALEDIREIKAIQNEVKAIAASNGKSRRD